MATSLSTRFAIANSGTRLSNCLLPCPILKTILVLGERSYPRVVPFDACGHIQEYLRSWRLTPVSLWAALGQSWP